MSKDIQLGVIVLALFIVGGALWLILVQILRPLAALTKSFSEIAEGEGDLTQQLHAERDDEIGRIVRYFNTFIGKLRTIMRGAQESAAEVSSLSTARVAGKRREQPCCRAWLPARLQMSPERQITQNDDMQNLADNVAQSCRAYVSDAEVR